MGGSSYFFYGAGMAGAARQRGGAAGLVYVAAARIAAAGFLTDETQKENQMVVSIRNLAFVSAFLPAAFASADPAARLAGHWEGAIDALLPGAIPRCRRPPRPTPPARLAARSAVRRKD